MGILKSLLLFIAGSVGVILTAVLIVAIAFGIIYVIFKALEWLFSSAHWSQYEPRNYD